MKPAARLQAAIEILDELRENSAPVDRALKGWAREHRFAGSKDRRAINARVYDCVRHAHLFAGRMGQDDGRALVLASLLHEGLGPDEIASLFDGDKFAPSDLTDDERARVAQPLLVDGAAALNLAEGLLTRLNKAFGDDLEAELVALNDRAPTDLRVNSLKADLAQAQTALRDEGVDTELFEDAPLALRVVGDADITRTAAYNDGWIELQDAGSQIVAGLCEVAPGEQVIDYCAGAGGKSLALAALMENKGQIYAHDTDKRRLGRMAARLERAGVRNVQRVDSAEGLAKADCVLLDVPCSGSGAWRRNPETRWRFAEDSFAALLETQAEILEAAKGLVKPGGRLCYVTCSVVPDENQAQIDRFLAENEEFSLDFATQLTPHRNGTDGFFFARLTRAS